MSSFLQYLLVGHVLFGLLGTIAFYAVWMGLLKKRENLSFLRGSALAGWLFFLLSWASGGYYYTTYYGRAVKPLIKAGQFSWAHSVVMETKEHVFLFLQFLAAVVFLLLWLAGEDLGSKPRLARPLTFLTGFLTVLGTALALAGVVISGAAR